MTCILYTEFKESSSFNLQLFHLIPEQATNYQPHLVIRHFGHVAISFKSFDQEKLITKRLLSNNTHCPLKAETQQHATFGQYVFNNTKALTKVTKDHQKKPKSLPATIIFKQIDSYNQWREPIQKSLSVLIRAPLVTISFNDTGFCSMLATILPSCKTNPNSLTISRLKAFWHKIQSTMTKRKQQ